MQGDLHSDFGRGGDPGIHVAPFRIAPRHLRNSKALDDFANEEGQLFAERAKTTKENVSTARFRRPNNLRFDARKGFVRT